MDDLLGKSQADRQDERVLSATLTKKMAEDLTDYLKEMGVRVRYLHSDIATIERAKSSATSASANSTSGRHQLAA